MRKALVLIAALIAYPAHSEVVSTSDSGFVIQSSSQAKASPMEVWRTLIAPSRWWSAEHSFSGDAANLYIDSQATGCFCEKLPLPADAVEGQRPGSVQHMRILYSQPGKLLRLSGALGPLQSEALNGTLSISLTPDDGGTKISWDYVVGGFMRFKADEIAPLVDKVLGEQMVSLAAQSAPRPIETVELDEPVKPKRKQR